jgi:hypothetical protein
MYKTFVNAKEMRDLAYDHAAAYDRCMTDIKAVAMEGNISCLFSHSAYYQLDKEVDDGAYIAEYEKFLEKMTTAGFTISKYKLLKGFYEIKW